MTHQNPNVPNDYNPAPEGMQAPTFNAPAHNFSNSQKEAVVELAESSHRDTDASHYTTSTGTGSGFGSGATTGTGAGLASGLGSSGHAHSGERGLDANRGEAAMSGRDFNEDRTIKGTHQETPNKAPHLASESLEHQNEINAVPGVGDAAPKEGKANVGGTNKGSFPNFGSSGTDFQDQAKVQQEAGGEGVYPPQRHAGKVGLGPHISTGDSLGDKIKHMLHPSSEKKHSEAVEDYRRDEEAQNPLNNPVAGHSSLSGNKGQLNPEDSKGMASKRLGEDSTTLGEGRA